MYRTPKAKGWTPSVGAMYMPVLANYDFPRNWANVTRTQQPDEYRRNERVKRRERDVPGRELRPFVRKGWPYA